MLNDGAGTIMVSKSGPSPKFIEMRPIAERLNVHPDLRSGAVHIFIAFTLPDEGRSCRSGG